MDGAGWAMEYDLYCSELDLRQSFLQEGKEIGKLWKESKRDYLLIFVDHCCAVSSLCSIHQLVLMNYAFNH